MTAQRPTRPPKPVPPRATTKREDPQRGRSSVGRTPAWHAGGQGFESPRLHRNLQRTPDLRRPPVGRFSSCWCTGSVLRYRNEPRTEQVPMKSGVRAEPERSENRPSATIHRSCENPFSHAPSRESVPAGSASGGPLAWRDGGAVARVGRDSQLRGARSDSRASGWRGREGILAPASTRAGGFWQEGNARPAMIAGRAFGCSRAGLAGGAATGCGTCRTGGR